MPEDPRFNPLRINPYVLFRALPQSNSYQMEELVSAMHQLFSCQPAPRLSPMSYDQILQQALVSIMARPTQKKLRKHHERHASKHAEIRVAHLEGAGIRICIKGARRFIPVCHSSGSCWSSLISGTDPL